MGTTNEKLESLKITSTKYTIKQGITKIMALKLFEDCLSYLIKCNFDFCFVIFYSTC